MSELRSSMTAAMGGLILLWSVGSPSAADEPPRVLGYERVYASANSDRVAAGQLLLGELNCTSCHTANEAASMRIQRKVAPVLDTVASRVKPDYLRRFL